MPQDQMLEIRFPSGASLSLTFPTAACLAAHATNRPAEAFYVSRPSALLRDIFRVPLVTLYRQKSSAVGRPSHRDYLLWDCVAERPLGTMPVPFTLHLSGEAEQITQQALEEAYKSHLRQEAAITKREEAAYKPGRSFVPPVVGSDFDAMERMLHLAHRRFKHGHVAQALDILTDLGGSLVGLGLNNTPMPPNDGWGHTTKDASVEDLLREGAAAEAGTDKHEQAIKQLLGEDNSKGAILMLMGMAHDQAAEIRALRQSRFNDLTRLNALGVWLKGELEATENEALMRQVLTTFALQLSRIGIDRPCPACAPKGTPQDEPRKDLGRGEPLPPRDFEEL